jgi:hypothetical protein
VVAVFVDDDVVVIPKPVVAESDVIRGDAEVEATEPETVWASAAEMPDVATAEAAGESSVLSGIVDVVVRIVAAGVMADPLAVGVDVRGVGVSGAVVEVSVVMGWRGMGIPHWSRAVGRDVGGAAADSAAMLSEDYDGNRKQITTSPISFFMQVPSGRPEGF